METAAILVKAVALIEILNEQDFLADDEIIADQHSGDRAEEARISHEPSENIASVTGHELPGLHGNADEAGHQAAGAETDVARRKIRKIVSRRDHVGGYVYVERSHQQSKHRENNGEGIT